MTIDFPNKIAHCKIDPESFNTDKAMKTLADIGFPATLVEDAK